MDSASLIGGLGLLIGLAGSLWYIAAILRGQTRPHAFTWIVWSILGGIGYFAQLHDDTGPGSWVLAANFFTSVATALLAFKYGEKDITRGDWISFISSSVAILPWLLTRDPLGSVILISLIDIVAFYPTVRKSWTKPREENLIAYVLGSLKFILSFFALQTFTINTTLYPGTIVAINMAFVLMCLIRRRQVSG